MQDFNKICTMLQNVHKHGVMTTNRYPKPSFSIGGAGSHVQSYKKSRYKIFSLLYFAFRAIAGQRPRGFSPVCRLFLDMPHLQFSEFCQTRVPCGSFQCSFSINAVVCWQQERKIFFMLNCQLLKINTKMKCHENTTMP